MGLCAKQQALIRFSYLLTNVNVILAPVQPTANRGSTTVMPEKLEAVIEVWNLSYWGYSDYLRKFTEITTAVLPLRPWNLKEILKSWRRFSSELLLTPRS